MLSFIGSSGRAFEALGREGFEVARGEVATRFPDSFKKRKTASACHESVALPFKAAVDSGKDPVGLLSLSLGKKVDSFEVVEFGATPDDKKSELHFVKLGSEVFPIQADADLWGKKSLTIYEPRPISNLKRKAIEQDGIAGFYGQKAEVRSITLFRDKGPTTHVQFDDQEVDKDLSYGWALWEVASSVLRRADRGKDGFGVGSAAALPSASSAPSVLGSLSSILNQSGKTEALGPPRGHDLLFAGAWRGRPLAITSYRDGQHKIAVAVQEKTPSGKLAWIDLALPDSKSVPVRGASAAIVGDELHIFGGLDAEGESLRSHFVLDLAAAHKSGWAGDLFESAQALEDGLAWPVVAATKKETLVLGGVGKFWIEGKKKVANHRRGMAAAPKGGSYWWQKKSHAPADVTNAPSAVGRDAVFVGPGTNRDGKVFAYDTEAGGEWVKLPELPQKIGLGQLHVVGETLVHSGGFKENGDPCRAIYSLDLAAPDPGWKKLGESDVVQGRAKLVESHGRMVALLVNGDQRATFYPA
ncbi:MAG: hypothetical protein HY791_33500 [Deltaproteobacteria bacterium]|nr:hypothetical protein [Deltaproteobacteria bacterium]